MMQRFAFHIFENRGHITRFEFFGTQTISTTKYRGPVTNNRFYIHIQRFANRARFFCAIKYGNLPHGFGKHAQERIGRERPIKMDFNQPKSGRQVRHCFFNCLARRPHRNDNIFRLFITDIFDQTIFTTGKRGKFIHTFLNNRPHRGVQFICGLASLEIYIGVLGGSANLWIIGIHTRFMILYNQIGRYQFAQDFIIYTAKA